MTKQTFDACLTDKNILWNYMVVLTIYNPQYKGEPRWWQFWKPKIPQFIRVEGALDYKFHDRYVTIATEVEKFKTGWLKFDFSEIFSIDRLN